MENLSSRTAQEVLDDHLNLAEDWGAKEGAEHVTEGDIARTVEEDMRRNVSEDIVILINRGTFRGHEGVRQLAAPINPSNLRNRSFAPLLKKASLPKITFHDLRHTTASLLFSKHVHPKFAQELLGHASVAFTLDTYSHMLPGMGGEAADAMGDALG